MMKNLIREINNTQRLKNNINTQQTDKKISNIFWVSSAIAIYMVICAHCVYENCILQKITSLFGSVGVPIFLIRSGFFLNVDEPAKEFWIKKLKTIIIPWMIISPFLYVVSVVLGHRPFEFSKCILYCIGYETWLYFVFILIAYYVIFRIFKSERMTYLLIALFFVSNILDIFGVNFITNISTPYLNFFNRIGYFAVGTLLKKNNRFCTIVNNRMLAAICLPLIVLISVVYVYCFEASEIPIALIFYRFLFVYCVFVISKKISGNKLLISLGKKTYLIYFLHMQFGIGISSVIIQMLNVKCEYIVFFLRPLLVLIVVVSIIFVLRKLVRLIKLEKYSWMVGLKP